MGTEILKSFGSLQSELEQAKSSLKGVDENIKRLIGRDPSELPVRPGQKKMLPIEDKGRLNLKNVNRNRNFPHENDEPPNKRRNNISVFRRLSDKLIHDDDVHHGPQKQIISKVIVTPKEIPSREEALEAQNKDEKFKARNKRMFGALLGTLQKFQQEETKLKPREEKRAQLEKKIEEHEIKEKEEIKKERQELFLNRKKKQAEIKIIELKMMRMKEYAVWEECQKPRSSYILTKAVPHIHYRPRRLNDKTKELLDTSALEIENMIEKKRQNVFEELKNIEDRMKRNFDSKYGLRELKVDEGKNEPEECDHDDQFDEVLTELPAVHDENEKANSIELNKTNVSVVPVELSYHIKTGNDKGNQDKENKNLVNDEDKLCVQEITTQNENVEECLNREDGMENENSEIA